MKISLRKLRFKIENDPVNLCLQNQGVFQNKMLVIIKESEYLIIETKYLFDPKLYYHYIQTKFFFLIFF
jgi:hypothetical protein